MPEAAESRRVLYCGRVQGVGFRFTARQIAQDFAITGLVRNLSNGKVELIAEGSASDIDRFLAAVAEAMTGYIDEQTLQKGPASGKFTAFEIAH